MATILIAGHDLTTTRTLNYILQQAGHSVVIADDARTVIVQLHDPIVQLLITEWRLPDMSGLDLLRRIRSDESRAHVPVVVLTSSPHTSDRRRGLGAGASAWLTRPLASADLTRVVAGLLLKRRPGAPTLQWAPYDRLPLEDRQA